MISMAQSGAQRKRDSIIDQSLKQAYDQVADEGVPDRFRLLLDALKEQEQQQGRSK
ncbi:hypothetical protein RD1_0086 [Roseobacter denitrificans OCh 114]|uniref:Anti-sigma factor NepR domain-containing protein n=2 Tax=Roseobacter denitrificans TaxID=2434 RepID=Q16DX1_ROSDO|nr:hypothetical protein RD1_0086 [Roseobacter denitrificans OCh 114]